MTTAPVLAADAAPVSAVPRHPGLRTVLVIAALLEGFDAASSVPTLFGDMSAIPGPGFGGFLIKVHIATHAPLALAALVFAAIGRVPYAIIALAAIVFMTWLNYMPSVVLHGLEFRGIGAFETPARIIAFPLMAACAIALAARNQRLRARHRAGQHSHLLRSARESSSSPSASASTDFYRSQGFS